MRLPRRRGRGRCPYCEQLIREHSAEHTAECLSRLLVRAPTVLLPESRRRAWWRLLWWGRGR
jgi:hypothetical protein